MGRPPLSLATGGKIRVWHELNGQWTARCGYRDYDGRTRLVERTRPTKGAAERALKETLRDRTTAVGAEEITPETRVAVLAEAWWADFQTRSSSPGTLRLYSGRLDLILLPALGELRVRELTVGRVHRFLQAVTQAHGQGSARTTRGVLSGMCAFAAPISSTSTSRR